jgi:hypothetical protein
MYKSVCFEGCPIESLIKDASESAIEAMSVFVRRRGVGLNHDRDEASQWGRDLGQARGWSSKSKSVEFKGAGEVHLTMAPCLCLSQGIIVLRNPNTGWHHRIRRLHSIL